MCQEAAWICSKIVQLPGAEDGCGTLQGELRAEGMGIGEVYQRGVSVPPHPELACIGLRPRLLQISARAVAYPALDYLNLV